MLHFWKPGMILESRKLRTLNTIWWLQFWRTSIILTLESLHASSVALLLGTLGTSGGTWGLCTESVRRSWNALALIVTEFSILKIMMEGCLKVWPACQKSFSRMEQVQLTPGLSTTWTGEWSKKGLGVIIFLSFKLLFNKPCNSLSIVFVYRFIL